MAEGIVDKYSEDKGYGLIRQDDGTEVFFERSSIEMVGYKTLTGGDRVSFEVKETVRGPEAKNVKLLSDHNA